VVIPLLVQAGRGVDAHEAEGFHAHAKAQGLETEVAPSKTREVVCRERLGGMLRHYERAAAAA
jgi:hypothetical protein